MRLLDAEYTAHPFFGGRQLTSWLIRRGERVNRKRVQGKGSWFRPIPRRTEGRIFRLKNSAAFHELLPLFPEVGLVADAVVDGFADRPQGYSKSSATSSGLRGSSPTVSRQSTSAQMFQPGTNGCRMLLSGRFSKY